MSHLTPPLLTRRALLSLSQGLLGLAGAGFLTACGATTVSQAAATPTHAFATAASTAASSAPGATCPGDQRAICTSAQQATVCPSLTVKRRGVLLQQSSKAKGQRGAKAHPASGAIKSGGRPIIGIRRSRT